MLEKVNIETNMDKFNGLKNQFEEIDYFRNLNFEKPRKYFIRTWGCQMNEHDSESLAGMLDLMGFARTNKKEDADVIIFNTCAVREKAEDKVFGNIGHLKSIKRQNDDLKIIVTGCMPELEYIQKKVKNTFNFIDLLLGTHSYDKFPKLLKKVYNYDKLIIDTEKEDKVVENIPANREYSTKAFVNIMAGCNNFCTYCIVPYTRGRERSRKPENIVEEIEKLVKKGVKEVTLLGQNVNSYGKTDDFNTDFTDLLELVSKVKGLKRIRFMTSHPKDINKGLIDLIAKNEKICNFLHLPVQAGSNKLLKKMNRNYTIEKYLENIDYAKNKIPNLALSTDIIIGFPTETDKDVQMLIDLLKEVEYDNVFTFIYSKRKGTPAADYDGQIPEDIKSKRFQKVLKVSNNIVIEKNKKYQDKIVKVLVEGESKNDKNVLTGKTETFKTVNFKGSKNLVGNIVDVKITEARKFTLFGEVVKNEN
ncbi:MAG: tRNA (N6-isopentenyl adenosine(37)-C2)-methylthiotransferase MiaB [Bacillota bacterium]